MFADQFVQQALEAKPAYYAGETDPAMLKAQQEAIQHDLDLYERFLKATTTR